VPDGSTIYVDASTSALALASALFANPPHELTIVTNSPMVLANTSGDSVNVVACPGELDHRMRAVIGRWTVDFLRQLPLDIAFMSGAGITVKAGLTTSRSPIADVLNAARDSAARTIGLVDATKFGRASLVSIATAHDLDLIITDETLSTSAAQQFADAGVKLLRAQQQD
jgi:DeoR/GlpR family transcriptional regulator of sugar metabolism